MGISIWFDDDTDVVRVLLATWTLMDPKGPASTHERKAAEWVATQLRREVNAFYAARVTREKASPASDQ